MKIYTDHGINFIELEEKECDVIVDNNILIGKKHYDVRTLHARDNEHPYIMMDGQIFFIVPEELTKVDNEIMTTSLLGGK